VTADFAILRSATPTAHLTDNGDRVRTVTKFENPAMLRMPSSGMVACIQRRTIYARGHGCTGARAVVRA
jgi:hypothetical protein